MSLREALQKLGYGPCYHMQVTLTHYSHMRFWIRAKAGATVDYREFFSRYKATVDWPACEFYKELMTALPWWFPRVVRQVHDDIIWDFRFSGEFTDRAKTIAVYKAHLEEVRRFFGRVMLAFRVLEWFVPASVLAGLLWLGVTIS